MNLIKLITKSLISICINLIIYIISSFIPKSKKIWLFGGWFGRRFADNSRYFYLYCNQFKEELGLDKVIWITEDACIYDDLKSKGFEVYKNWSIKSIWYHFRAKNIFVDQGPNDVNKYFCIRCNRINMWHGFPLKKIGSLVESIDFKLDDLYNKYFKLGGWSKYYLQVTSKLSREILSKAFNINDRRTIMSGYPRNDVFSNDYWNCYLSESERIAMNNIQIYKKKGYNVIFYLPTFRDNKNIELLNIKSQVELQELTEFLKNNKILLVTKFHFAQDDTQFEYSIDNNILNLESIIDVYPILTETHILITDYSSVYFDFLITKKPIIFYPFDLEYYSDPLQGRGLIFDYNEFTPGSKAYTINQLLDEIDYVINNKEKYINKYNKQYDKITKIVFDDNKENCSENLAKKIKKLF